MKGGLVALLTAERKVIDMQKHDELINKIGTEQRRQAVQATRTVAMENALAALRDGDIDAASEWLAWGSTSMIRLGHRFEQPK